MSIKLLSMTCSKKVPHWFHLRAYVTSVSSVNNVQILPEIEQKFLSTCDFEAKLHFLRNQLHPESLIRVLDSTQDLDSSLKLFKWASLQKRFCHTADTYYEMILKLGMAGKVEGMEGFCKEMVKETYPGTEAALVALINLFVKNGKLNEALRVLVVLSSGSYRPSIGVFNVLLGVMVKEKRNFSDVLFVYKEMVKAGIVPTIDTLNYLLEALFDSDRFGTALDQYRRMKKKRCNPNSRTFEILVSRLVARNQVDASLVVLDDMFELKFEPDLSFFSCIIPLFCGLNKLDVGMKLFILMKSSNILPDFRVYEALIQCTCENQLLHDARNLVEEMTKHGLTPSDDVLVDIVESFCKLGKFVEATKFLEDKHIWGSDPRNALLEGYCVVGNFLAAEVLFINMLERDLAGTISWNILIRWLSEIANLNKALKFLGKMIVSSYVPNSDTYSALILGKCRLAKYKDALALFHHVSSKSWVLDSSSYAELVECLCQNGMTRGADQVFNYMSYKRCTLQLRPFKMLIKGHCADGNVDRAIRLLFSDYYSGTSCLTETYNALMLGLLKAGKPKNLLVVLSRMVVEGCPLDGETYGILIESMISIGCTKDHIFFFNLMVSESLLPDSETLDNLLSCFAKRSQLHMIVISIDKLLQNEEILNSDIFNTLIKGLWIEGYKTVACRLLDVMLEKGWIPDAITHGLLMGSVVRKEEEGKLTEDGGISMQDSVSDILAEGLGET